MCIFAPLQMSLCAPVLLFQVKPSGSAEQASPQIVSAGSVFSHCCLCGRCAIPGATRKHVPTDQDEKQSCNARMCTHIPDSPAPNDPAHFAVAVCCTQHPVTCTAPRASSGKAARLWTPRLDTAAYASLIYFLVVTACAMGVDGPCAPALAEPLIPPPGLHGACRPDGEGMLMSAVFSCV